MIENTSPPQKTNDQRTTWSNQDLASYATLGTLAVGAIVGLGKLWSWLNSPPDLTEEYEKDLEQRRKEWDRIRSGEEILLKRDGEEKNLRRISEINSLKEQLAQRNIRIKELESNTLVNEFEDRTSESSFSQIKLKTNASKKIDR